MSANEPSVEPRGVVVGIAPADDQSACLEYAATQARRRRCGVHLVHAIHPVYLGPAEMSHLNLLSEQIRREGEQVLARCAAQVRELLDDESLHVTTELVHGPVVPSVVAASEDAGLVVLQRRHLSAFTRIVTMSISSAIAAKAHTPVVVVPEQWQAGARSGGVVVGVEDAETSLEVVRAALGAARESGTGLRMLHAWWVSDYDGVVFEGEAGVQRTAKLRAALEEGLAPLLAEFPDVTTELIVRHGRPADALVALSGTATLLVAGRHDPSVPFGSHLGPVTRAALRESACPVLVVDPRPVERRADAREPLSEVAAP